MFLCQATLRAEKPLEKFPPSALAEIPKFLLFQRNLLEMLETFPDPFLLLFTPKTRGCGRCQHSWGNPNFQAASGPSSRDVKFMEYFPAKTLIFPLKKTNAGCAQIPECWNPGVPNTWLWIFTSRSLISVPEDRTLCLMLRQEIQEFSAAGGVWQGGKLKLESPKSELVPSWIYSGACILGTSLAKQTQRFVLK